MFHVPDKFVGGAASAGLADGADFDTVAALFAAAALLAPADFDVVALVAGLDVVGGTAKTWFAPNMVTKADKANRTIDLFVTDMCI